MIGPARLALVPQGHGLGLQGLGAQASVSGLMLGRRVEEVARLLPALFGLCRSVQETALALALDQPAPDPAALRRDMIRDHLAKLCLHLPRRLGLPVQPLPQGWAEGGAALHRAIEGLAAPILAAVAQAFRPGEAVSHLPVITDPFAETPGENSLATRHAGHHRLRAAQAQGHGPLAHLVARVLDLEALALGQMPSPRRLPDGTALVPCSRGMCALRLRVAGGIVTGFDRATPTDHLLMPGGLLAASLATLPADRAGLAPLLVDILDPCIALQLEGAAHA